MVTRSALTPASMSVSCVSGLWLSSTTARTDESPETSAGSVSSISFPYAASALRSIASYAVAVVLARCKDAKVGCEVIANGAGRLLTLIIRLDPTSAVLLKLALRVVCPRTPSLLARAGDGRHRKAERDAPLRIMMRDVRSQRAPSEHQRSACAGQPHQPSAVRGDRPTLLRIDFGAVGLGGEARRMS